MPSASLNARKSPLASAAVQIEALGRIPLEREFASALAQASLWPLSPMATEVFQINVGKRCNMTCRHCHVDAGPDRTEVMTRETMQTCLLALAKTSIPTVDITGGAPELNPDWRWFIEQCRKLGRHVINRCNLTVLDLVVGRELPEFFAHHQIELVCSLPHYRQPNTDAQRGEGIFERSIAGLRRLNSVGYGDGRSGLRLCLVTNPAGAFLPTGQASLEREWKREMQRLYGVCFDALYCLTNMPIGRFLEWLLESGNAESYLQRLAAAFNPAAAGNVMCRTTISVGWDGRLYDCDFNQMLDISLDPSAPQHVRDFDDQALQARRICVASHCFGCTAGAGSSCGGATA